MHTIKAPDLKSPPTIPRRDPATPYQTRSATRNEAALAARIQAATAEVARAAHGALPAPRRSPWTNDTVSDSEGSLNVSPTLASPAFNEELHSVDYLGQTVTANRVFDKRELQFGCSSGMLPTNKDNEGPEGGCAARG